MANISEAKGQWIVPTKFIRDNRKILYKAIDEINQNDGYGFNWFDESFDQGEVNDRSIKEVKIPEKLYLSVKASVRYNVMEGWKPTTKDINHLVERLQKPVN